MPLIKNGAEIENEWVFVEDADFPPPSTGEVGAQRSEGAASESQSSFFRPAGTSPASGGGNSYAFADFILHADALASRNSPIGVRLSPEDDPAELIEHLDRIALIEISFPKYTDGRGYSQAQLLRRRYGYTGELRAVGHVLRDQILYMHRSGFDAFETSRADLSDIVEALQEYAAFYQPAADPHLSVFARRHQKA